jgi:hypothetical protein
MMQLVAVTTRAGRMYEALKEPESSKWLVIFPEGTSEFSGNTKQLRAHLKTLLREHTELGYEQLM